MNKNKLTIKTQRRLTEHFVSKTTAQAGSEIVDVNPKTAESFGGKLELDESYLVQPQILTLTPTSRTLFCTGRLI